MSLKNTYRKVLQNMGNNNTYDWYGALSLLTAGLFLICIVNIFFFVRFTLSKDMTTEATGTNNTSLTQTDIENTVKKVRERDGAPHTIPSIVRIDPSF